MLTNSVPLSWERFINFLSNQPHSFEPLEEDLWIRDLAPPFLCLKSLIICNILRGESLVAWSVAFTPFHNLPCFLPHHHLESTIPLPVPPKVKIFMSNDPLLIHPRNSYLKTQFKYHLFCSFLQPPKGGLTGLPSEYSSIHPSIHSFSANHLPSAILGSRVWRGAR